jgi:hypothetical protein
MNDFWEHLQISVIRATIPCRRASSLSRVREGRPVIFFQCLAAVEVGLPPDPWLVIAAHLWFLGMYPADILVF